MFTFNLYSKRSFICGFLCYWLNCVFPFNSIKPGNRYFNFGKVRFFEEKLLSRWYVYMVKHIMIELKTSYNNFANYCLFICMKRFFLCNFLKGTNLREVFNSVFPMVLV